MHFFNCHTFLQRGAMKGCLELQEKIGYTFKHVRYLETALTHSSWANESKQTGEHNERQEFLGDAVLELCVSWALFTRFPHVREGDLTRTRSALVSAKSLAYIARELHIDKYLRLGKGEESQGGRQRDTVLSDAFEAVLGAIFEDGGYTAAYAVVTHIFSAHWPVHVDQNLRKDYKTQLQEAIQRIHKDRPIYVLQESSGPEHAKEYKVRLTLPDGRVFFAKGQSLKRAEQEAARVALDSL